ncbi:MAG: helix-turn-helix domain-containing protein [Actinobacteria bacterium]|nr:helix-turn-helix domain-containing protein [Actinomycetota bacterium]
MRAALADSVALGASDEPITTGEAARLLGTSRQHVVDLCTAGDLPFTTVGKHRRLRRRDIDLLKDADLRLTRDQVRSLLLSYAVAGRLAIDPEAGLALARLNLEKMRGASPRGAAKVWLDEWAQLLDGPLLVLLTALTSRSPRSRELRQNSPFAGVLSDEERLSVLANLPSARQTDDA